MESLTKLFKLKNDHQHEMIREASSNYNGTHIDLAKNRILWISEDVTTEMASVISAFLLHYDSENSEQDITLYIHTNGGDANGLAQIYDTMQIISSPVKTVCVGKAFSAGAFILATGSKGKRYAFRHSSIMIHGLQCLFPTPGDHDQIGSKNYYNFLNNLNNNILKILSDHTGQPLDKVKIDCSRDLFLTAEDALKYGIIDGIL